MGISMTFLSGCGEDNTPVGVSTSKNAPATLKNDPDVPREKGSRDNTPI